jgi:hypothetical protein
MSAWADFRRAISAEALKSRKTLALWLVSVLPAAPAGLQLILQLSGNSNPAGGIDPWLWLSYGVILSWTLFVLPLFVALETGLLAGVEHGANGWKHIFTLPVRRGPVYAAKIAMVSALVAAAHIMLCVWTLVAGAIMGAFSPELKFALIPPGELLLFAAASFVGSLLMVSIHAWISLRWQSLVLNVGIAVVALVVNLSLIDSDLRRFVPWLIPMDLTNGILKQALEQATSGIPAAAVPSLATGLLGGLLVSVVAVVMLSRRDVY